MKRIIRLLFILLIAGCGGTLRQPIGKPVEYFELRKFQPGYQVEKACYNSIQETSYLWEKGTERIHIYQQDKQINTVGGRGLERINFQKLSDICLYPDGSLLALDEIGRSIKKFDSKGRLISEINISKEINPVLVAVSIDEKLYVFDPDRKEIIQIDNMGREVFALSNLAIEEIAAFQIRANQFVLYDSSRQMTLFISLYGDLLFEESGRCFQERGNIFCCDHNFISYNEGREVLTIKASEWEFINYQAPELVLYDGEYLYIGMVKYEK